MRHRVFLAVLLSLMLGLLKGNDTEITPPSAEPPTSNSTGNDTEITPPSAEPPTSNSTGNDTEITPPSAGPPTSNSTGNDTDITPPSAEPPNSNSTEDFCSSNPCGKNYAKCVSLKSNYTCQCDYGFYFSDNNCYKGKVFPGFLSIQKPYTDNFQIVNSTEYEELFKKVTEFFKEAFSSLNGYEETVIVEIQPQNENRDASRIRVTVSNMFLENSSESSDSVSRAVNDAIKAISSSLSYKEAQPCEVFQCDTQTTVCVENPDPECICKSGLEKTEWDKHSCSVCSKTCSEEAKTYCAIEKGVPTCKCMTNFKNEGGKCVACPVGYSGVDCNDNTELILIIVGSVFGAIILSLVITVSVVSSRVKHKPNPEKKKLMKSGYPDTNIPDDRPSMMFPRVQTTSGHANPGYQPNNPYDMHSTNRGHFSGRDYDDLYEASREPRGFRMQNRY